ncbi:MAG: phosphotransferase [Actinomycetaceae bacterium]|nr:phosphotransferase [Actinomycetaceae bacterium]
MTPLYLAALAVQAIDGLEAVGTRGNLDTNTDFISATVIDARGRHWLVKYPTNSFAGASLEAEAALAPELLSQLRSSHLPFDIVRPAGWAYTEDRRAFIYPEPFGVSQVFEEMTADEARALGRAIASIHSLSPSIINNAGLPVYTSEQYRQRLMAELSDADHTDLLPPLLRRRWDDALHDHSLWDFIPTVVHGDVCDENFLWSNGTITTVLGWGEAQVADPALDLASLLPLTDDLLQPAVHAYENTRGITLDEATRLRTAFMSEFSIVRWLMYGVNTNNSAVQKGATRMLAELADDVASDPELSGPTWNIED